MLKNYIKIAWRNLLRSRIFSIINIAGLALGLTTCILIVLYVVDEISYDRFHENASRIYRVNEDLKLGDNAVQYAVAMAPLAQTLIKDFPEVENAARLLKTSLSIKKGEKFLIENDAVFADPSVFDVFTIPLIHGSKASALTEPNTIVLSQSSALRYFNKVNIVGQSLTIPGFGIFKITGVIEDIPRQSHFKADFMMSMSTWRDSRSTGWLQSNYNTYVLLRKGASPKQLESKFPQLLKDKSGAEMQQAVGMDVDQFEKKGNFFRLNLMPLTAIHLHSNMTGELGANGTVQYVYIFSAIALFILLIACFNFINLSTARSSNRAREVGVRKVLGSPRRLLIGQFLTESILVTSAATVIAVIATLILLPAFNTFSGKEIAINTDTFGWFILALIVTILVVGFIAGAYPALFLSRFQPVEVLKGKLATGFKGSKLRSFLVVFQFSISVFLIIGTLVVYNQLRYIQSRDLGYNRNQVLVIKNAFALKDQAQAFKQEIKKLTGVVNVTLSGFLPVSGNRGTDVFFKDATKDPKQSMFPQIWRIDEDYVKTLDMKIVAGRNFSSQMGTDSSAIIINESAARFLGFTDPLNKILYRADNEVIKPFTIIGVVKDFNFNSLRENISPVVMHLNKDNGSLAIRVQGSNLPALINQIKNTWDKLAPATQLEYSFMDADFEATYRTEQRMGQLFIIFTTLAIIIACLGLFGLSAYAAEQRTREIGIRKVLGASIPVLVKMLSVDFIKLVIIAILIATPLAWFIMQNWLQDFAYRISIAWWILAVAAVTAILIALVTIGFQALKAALTNPVKSLRTE
jgi:putative ABC transport system permease protein